MSFSFSAILLNVILILLPVTIYLVYIAYVKNLSIEKKNMALSIVIYSQIYLLVRYAFMLDEVLAVMMTNIPLILAYLKKNKITAIIVSIFCIYFSSKYLQIYHCFLVLEYSIYFLIYIYIIKKKLKPRGVVATFIILKAFFISLKLNVYIYPLESSLDIAKYSLLLLFPFTIVCYLTVYFLYKGESMIDYNSMIHQAEKEKQIRQSLFKITHEIKNPIAVCKGYIDMMDINDPEKVVKYTKIIKGEIDRTIVLMDDLLSCNRVKIEKEEVDLYLVLEEIEDSIKPLLLQEKINGKFIIPDDELYIELDYYRIKQVLINLIKNAIEAKKGYNDEIIVSVKQNKDSVTIIIKDNGKGMDNEVLSRVYDMFYTTKEKGTGLGVSLSKEIVELHKGTLTYKSSLEKGTTAIIKLPL